MAALPPAGSRQDRVAAGPGRTLGMVSEQAQVYGPLDGLRA
jgi:hypothetical protein